MENIRRFISFVLLALVLASSAFVPAGCGEDKPEAKAKDAAVISVEPGPAAPKKVQTMPRTRYVKEEVNKTMDDEAAKRAKQMDQIFR